MKKLQENYSECWTYPKQAIDEMFNSLTADDVGALPLDATAEDVGALPSNTKVIDISDKFEFTLNSGSGFIFAFYDPASKTVRGNFCVSGNETNITTTTPIFTMKDENYLPPDSYGFNAVMTVGSSTDLVPYYGVVNKDGEILQKLGSTIKNIYGVFEYTV